MTTSDESGAPHVAPMGPKVDAEMRRIELRPFRSSRTYANLKRLGEGVLHVTDDVELLARAAVDRLASAPPVVRAEAVNGWILVDACRWYAFRVTEVDDRQQRVSMRAEVLDRGRLRDFFGFNRAKHAVLEAAILATRVSLLPPEQILEEFERLAVPVRKTAGAQENRAFQFLEQYVRQALRVESGR